MQQESFTEEVILWVILAISILLFISNFGIGGAIGNAVSSFFFGVFGLIAYIFPVVLVIGTFFAASNKGNRIATVKIVAAVFLAVLNPGDKFMGLNLAHGGHLSHGSLVNTSGIIYTPCEYNLKQETGRVDYDQMEEVALREKPKMIIGGGSAYSREWDYKRMREIADKVGAILMIDMAHPAGLIAAGLLDNPVKYAHIVTSTTHKTLRGPRGGVIMMGKDFPNPWGKKTPKGEIKMMSQLLDSAVFPGVQGGPLEHVIAAKAVAFGEILQPEYKEYAKQVQKNAAVLACLLYTSPSPRDA